MHVKQNKRIASYCLSVILILCLFFSILLLPSCRKEDPAGSSPIKLGLWDRGVRITSTVDSSKFAYLWFYEWHLFDAVKKGEHTPGRWDWKWHIGLKAQSALLDTDWVQIKLRANDTGADILMKITNLTDYDWPAIAAIIPCFNPGTDMGKVTDALANPGFFDDQHQNTWFIGEQGADLIKGEKFPREIHFNTKFLSDIASWEKESGTEDFVFSSKWPTSKRNAVEGMMIREDNTHKWVMGIAWDDFLSAQGHNPWKCMHLSVRVGPLKSGASKVIRGKIYLFEGSKEDCIKKFHADFQAKP
jgi:hypothetical protein